MDELVLSIESDIVNQFGFHNAYSLDIDRYLPVLLAPERTVFLPRMVAESDTRYKQLIPYAILRYHDLIFSYVRGKRSGEKRLVSSRSIGIGGHIGPMDQSLFLSNLDMYLAAAQREVSEEVSVATAYQDRITALINDDSTDVGKVHLGIMHIWDLAEPKVAKREGLITQAGFLTLNELKSRYEELESWSQISLKVLEDARIPAYNVPPVDLSSLR